MINGSFSLNFGSSLPVCKKKANNSSPRKILKKGATASLGDDCGYDLKKKSLFHANRRIDLFFLDCVLRQDAAVRSNGDVFDPKTRIGFTSLQGDSSQVEGYHASHSNTGAVFDQVFPLYLSQIKAENKITPQKKKQLKRIGITDEQLKILLDPSKDEEEYKKIIALVKMQRSFIYRTTFEESQNLTVPLPRDSNLMIDKWIENHVRENFLVETLSRLMQGKISPEEATEEYVKVIDQELENFAEALEDFEMKFNHAYRLIQDCINIEKIKKIKEKHTEKYRENINQLKEVFIEIKKASKGIINFGLRDLKSTIQSFCIKQKKPSPINRLAYKKRLETLWRNQKYPRGFYLNKATFNQTESVKSRLTLLHKMISYQRSGTKSPDFNVLLRIEGGGKSSSKKQNIGKIKKSLFI